MITAILLATTILLPAEPHRSPNHTTIQPGAQEYVYSDDSHNTSFSPDRKPITDGNEEEEYVKKERQVRRKQTESLPIEKIIPREVAAEKAGTRVQPKAAPVKIPDPVMVHTVYFRFDESSLSVDEQKKLADTTNDIKKHDRVIIRGRTDSAGPKDHNNRLAEQRAHNTKNFLIERGIQKEKIETESEGKCCYASDTNDKNRRAEIWIEEKR